MGCHKPALQINSVVRFHRLLLEFLPGQLLEYPLLMAKALIGV